MASASVSQQFRFRGPLPQGYIKSRTVKTLTAATFILGYSHISNIYIYAVQQDTQCGLNE